MKFIVAHECNWPRTKKMCVGSLVFVDCRVSAFATFSQAGLCPPSMLGRREILQTEPGSGYHTIPRAGPASPTPFPLDFSSHVISHAFSLFHLLVASIMAMPIGDTHTSHATVHVGSCIARESPRLNERLTHQCSFSRLWVGFFFLTTQVSRRDWSAQPTKLSGSRPGNRQGLW